MNLYKITIENHVKGLKTDEWEGNSKYEVLGKVFSYYGQYRTYFRLVEIKQLTQQELI